MEKMGERKLYKTKLCALYQRGGCHRLTCSFAHGNAELRRFSSSSSSSFHGRRGYRSSDLRDKLDRRRSPPRRFSLERDARGRTESRGYSPPRSLRESSARKHRKKQQLDGQSDFSGSLKLSDGTDDQVKDKKLTSSDSKDALDLQLRQMQSELDTLDDHKRQLEIYLEERIQETDGLTSKIQELEMQFGKEKEECKRITSKIKKFIKAHSRHSRLQDELKRSQARLQKLGDQLASDASRPVANEEDSSINIMSDGETAGNLVLSPYNELQKDDSPSRKRLRTHLEADQDLNQVNPTKGEQFVTGTTRSEKFSRWKSHRAQYNNNKAAVAEASGKNGCKPLANEDKPNREKNISVNIPVADKLRGSESGHTLPSTSIAAHAVDKVVDVEMEEKLEVFGIASTGTEKGVSFENPSFPYPLPPPPPLPPIHRSAYLQYEGGDEKVDREGVEDEMVNVDIV